MSDFIICVDNIELPVRVARPRSARNFRLSYDATGPALRLTVPPRASLREGRAWAESQQEWIARQMTVRPKPIDIAPDAMMLWRGEQVRIDWSPDYRRTPHHIADTIQVGGPAEAVGRRLRRWIIDEAHAAITGQTLALAAREGLVINGVGFGDTRSRWGSCSTDRNIRFSWRLMMAPDFVREATIAHEVAHLVEMNHSRAFHRLVHRYLGHDAAPASRWLRDHGPELHRYRFDR